MKSRSKIKVRIDREVDGRWIAEIEGIPGAVAYGDTKAEAVANARERRSIARLLGAMGWVRRQAKLRREEMKVYVVARGERSEGRDPVAVFRYRQAAEDFAKWMRSKDSRVDESVVLEFDVNAQRRWKDKP